MMPEPPVDESPEPTAHNLAELTVGELAMAIKRTLEGAFGQIRVRGEISRPNYHSSGHLYVTLKDDSAAIDGVCWRGTVERLGLRIEEGMEVIVTGRVSSYPRSSKYQIVIESVVLAGQGALLKLLEDRRRRLATEGLFDADRKKKIPFLPEVIGVITSPTGAVIRDILHRLADRFPRHVLLWPVTVQGDSAAAQIAAAIAGFNLLTPGGAVPRPDVLIVARGGGSLEDLWAFNEEVVVRAAASSEIPLISAVGHETDTTLIDFAADLRAPTPTAAAEMAVPVRVELLAQVMEDGARLAGAMVRLLAERRLRLDGLARGLPDPQSLLAQAMQRLDSETDRLGSALRALLVERGAALGRLGAALRHPRETLGRAADRLEVAAERLAGAMRRGLADAATRIATHAKLLDSLSYRNVLARGYAVAWDVAGQPITAASAAAPDAVLALEFHDGSVGVRVTGPARPRTPAPDRTRRSPRTDRQGRLL